MLTIFEKIQKNPLFKGIHKEDFESMFSCMQGKIKQYQKGEIIQLAGNPVKTIGILSFGSVQILRENEDGKQNLMAELKEGELFGEVFACAGVLHSPVTVQAVQDCEILHMNYRKIITSCSSSCRFHQQLIENMLTLVAQKNLMLNQKIEILSKRTIRERILFYFNLERQDSACFQIPFNQEELASYLCVDRSALSSELSKMQKEGLIDYTRNHFQIKKE